MPTFQGVTYEIVNDTQRNAIPTITINTRGLTTEMLNIFFIHLAQRRPSSTIGRLFGRQPPMEQRQIKGIILECEENPIEIPLSLYTINSLVKITIKNNENYNEIPRDIRNLNKLKYLEISNCNLSNIPNELTQMSTLRKINLSYNNIREIPPNLFLLSGLEYINFNNNRIRRIPSTNNLTYIDEFYINDNNLTHREDLSDLLIRGYLRLEYRNGNPFNEEEADRRDRELDDGEEDTEEEGEDDDDAAQIAMEVHDAFRGFDTALYLQYIRNYVGDYNPTHIRIVNYVPTRFTNHVEKNKLYSYLLYLVNQKEASQRDFLTQQLKRIFIERLTGVFLTPEQIELTTMTMLYILKVNFSPLNDLYIETYIRDCVYAYSRDHEGMSCVKGILERFILNLTQAVKVLCCGGNRCESEELMRFCGLIRFMEVTNDNINDVLREWIQQEDDTYEMLTPSQRKEIMINYIINNFIAGIDDEFIRREVRDRIVRIINEAPFNTLKFTCKDKSEMIFDPEDCEEDNVAVGGKQRKTHKNRKQSKTSKIYKKVSVKRKKEMKTNKIRKTTNRKLKTTNRKRKTTKKNN